MKHPKEKHEHEKHGYALHKIRHEGIGKKDMSHINQKICHDTNANVRKPSDIEATSHVFVKPKK